MGLMYQFEEEWHEISQEEIDAVDRTGRSNWESYAWNETEEVPPEPFARERMVDMLKRPNKTPVVDIRAALRTPVITHAVPTWTGEETSQLLVLRKQGFTWMEISAEMDGRTPVAVRVKYDHEMRRLKNYATFSSASERNATART